MPLHRSPSLLAAMALASLWLLPGCSQPITPGGGGFIVDGQAGVGDSGATTATDTVSAADGATNPGLDGGGTPGTDTGTDTGAAPVDGGDIPKVDGGGSTPNPAGYSGYPSKELRIRIVGPSGRRHAVVSGKVIDIAGVLFGHADAVTWTHSGGQSGTAYGSPFFQTGKIELNPGDNTISVTAKKGDLVATDSIVVTYNQIFNFPDRLHADPRVAKVGQATEVHTIVNLGKASNFVAGSLKVYRVDDNGNTVGAPKPMVDDGNLGTNGDEIKGDGLYSTKFTVNDAQPGIVRLRASLLMKVGAQQYAAYTDIAEVEVVPNVTQESCQQAKGALDAARSAANTAGGGKAGRQAALDALKGGGLVSHAGVASGDGNGVWVRFNSGLLGAVNLNPQGTRGGDPRADSVEELPGANYGISTVRVQSKRALLLDPFAKEFGPDEIAGAFEAMSANACPAYTVEGAKVLTDNLANLSYYRRFYDHGIVAMATHGDALFSELPADVRQGYRWPAEGSEEVLWTGHAIDCSYFAKAAVVKTCTAAKNGCDPGADCFLNKTGGKGVCVDHLTADVQRGRVLLGADSVYGITPAFIRHHADKPFPRSLIYLGACRSLWNGSLAAELFAAGAAAVVGYTGYVESSFATQWGKTLFSNLIAQKQLSGSALVNIEDKQHPGTFITLVGAKNLDAAHSDIMNPSWESGDLQGWLKAGDGRVIAKLGANVPVDGKFMGIISTGLGYTVQTGTIEQKFCVQPGVTKLSFWWKFYSEEFKEYCGSEYQDAFTGRVDKLVNGKKVLVADAVNVKVDDLCETNCKGSNSCFGNSCAGKCAKQFKGLMQSDVSFDKGDVWMTPWVQSEADVSSVAGQGAVVLKLFATDVGDSIFDTAVLIDKIDLK